MRTFTTCLAALCLCPALLRADEPAKARTVDEIKKKLAEITAPSKESDAAAAERDDALRRLKAYRYLAGVPYEDVALDADYNAACAAAARLLAKLGRLDHQPPNDGLPEDEYKLAQQGAGRSNLAMGFRTLAKAVDTWMGDSDRGNIDRMGHRRWCLHPAMKLTGFGRSGLYSAMYAFDHGRKEVPEFDVVAWPPRGPAPVEYFRAGWAWTVSVNPARYNPPGKDVTANVYPANDKGEKTGDAVKLNYNNIDTQGFGIPNCVIFRPARVAVEPGKPYVVEIDGMTQGREKTPASLRYVVEFVSVK